MNSNLLLGIAKTVGENINDIAAHLGVTRNSVHRKLNTGTFTQREIQALITAYGLTPEKVQAVFFDD